MTGISSYYWETSACGVLRHTVLRILGCTVSLIDLLENLTALVIRKQIGCSDGPKYSIINLLSPNLTFHKSQLHLVIGSIRGADGNLDDNSKSHLSKIAAA